MPDDKLFDEAARLAALHRYEVLDTSAEQVFDSITALVKSVFDVPIVTVSLVDADRQWFKSRQGLNVCETSRNISFCTRTIQHREPMLVEDTMLDNRFRLNPLVTGAPYIRSYFGAPLTTPDGYNVGSLCAIDTRPRSFDKAQVAILKQFATLVVGQLELRRISTRDHLTGVMTRRATIEAMEKIIALFKRYRRPAAIVILDIDHFKRVNDSFGHQAGDRVLREVAARCRAQLRSGDEFGRIGGEEFLVLLPETGPSDAMLTAERFRQALLALVVNDAAPVRITASFGIAALNEDCLSADSWLARADEALYAAKRSGRNCCRLADVGDEPAIAV